MTRAVVRKELAGLWASPVPYVLGVLLHAVLGVLYVNQLEVRAQAVLQPLFPIAGFLLLFTVPVLTMRMFAEEARTGTLDLLLAVPVPARPLVVGKWLAAWLTGLAVLAPAVVFVWLLHWFGNPDTGPMVAGFIGLALLAGAVAGIGVLASSLTSSQPVAAMVAVFVVLLLWFASAGDTGLTAGELLAHLSLSERLRSFAGGGIDTSDVGFLVAVVVGALALSALAVDGRRLR